MIGRISVLEFSGNSLIAISAVLTKDVARNFAMNVARSFARNLARQLARKLALLLVVVTGGRAAAR